MHFDKLEINPEKAGDYSLRYAYHDITMNCSDCGKQFYALPFYICTADGSVLCTDCADNNQIMLADITRAYNTDIGIKMAERDSKNGQTFQIAVGMKRDAIFTIDDLETLSEHVLTWADENGIESAWYMRDCGAAIRCGENNENEKSVLWSEKAAETAEKFESIETLNIRKKPPRVVRSG